MQNSDLLVDFDGRLAELRERYIDLIQKSSTDQCSDVEALAETCKSRRAALGLSQSDLAELSGLALRTVAKVESGDDSISFKNLKKMLAAIGVELCIKS